MDLTPREVVVFDAVDPHLLDDPLPEGMCTPPQEAVVVYARTSTWFQPITDDIGVNLAEHVTTQQIMEISFTIAAVAGRLTGGGVATA